MPRRWLSTGGRKEAEKNSRSIEDSHNGFDFAFTEPQVFVQCRDRQNVEVLRPTTSAGDRDRSKRKPDLTLLIERPRSFDSAYTRTPLSARFDTSKIGLAFGSPRHPPQEFASMTATTGVKSRQLACCDEESTRMPVVKSKKWKLNPFYKQRMESQKDVPCQIRTQNSDPRKLGLPIQRTPWRNPKSPPMSQAYLKDEAPPPPPEKDEPHRRYQARCTVRSDVVPVVNISIPKTPLDRASIMFKDVDGFRHSGLLSRRSRELDGLMLAETTKPRRDDLEIPQLQRRVTSPTIRSKRDLQPGTSSNTNLQKYSLFPATPTNTRFPSHSASPQARRSHVIAASISAAPEIGAKKTTKQEVSDTTSNDCSKETMDPRETNPASKPSTEPDARISSNSEIFFDVKSFRDSSGQIGQQFEIMRAPPTTVQLKRSKSKMTQKLDLNHDYERTQLTACNANKPTAEQIDETIKIVERLTSPSSTPPRATSSSVKVLQDAQLPVQSASGAEKISGKGKPRSWVGSLSFSVPSPVPEAAEEEVPHTNELLRSKCYGTKKPSRLETVPLQAASYPKRAVSPPHPAIIKDTHNIPLSKYAPRHIAEELAKQTGLRPVRKVRANTDSSIFYNAKASNSRRPEAQFRSPNLPILSQTPRSKPAATESAPSVSEPGVDHWQDVPVKITYVNPTAEVSIARAVSLSRQPSAKVPVTRHQARAASKSAPEQVTEKTVSLGVVVLQEVERKHKHGHSVGVVLETATIAASSPPPPIPSSQTFEPNTHSKSSSTTVAV